MLFFLRGYKGVILMILNSEKDNMTERRDKNNK